MNNHDKIISLASLFILETTRAFDSLEKPNFESVFFLDRLSCYRFVTVFVDLQMSAEWKLAFINTFITISCLIWSLNIPHSNQNLSFFLVEGSVSIS